MPLGRRSAALALAVGVIAASTATGEELWIRDVRLVDGTGAPPREDVAVLVRAGRIAAIEAQPDGTGAARVIDAAGLTLLPGLIDAHVLFVAAPGSAARGDSDARIEELNRAHLRGYLACGVTTVFDAGAFPETVRALRTELAAGAPGPRYLTTGPYVRPPGGYGHPRFGEDATPAEVERKLDLLVALGAAGAKTAIEEQLGGAAPLSAELRAALVAGAARRGLPLYIHARSEATQREALALRPRALMHAAMDVPMLGEWLAPPDFSDDFVRTLRASGTYQLSTLSLLDTWPGLFDTALLADPRLILVVPRVELETARAPDAEQRFADGVLGWAAPWTPRAMRPWLARTLFSRPHLEAGLQQGQRNLRRLHAAGVPIVAATDAPSPWPDAIYHFHGVQLARELELLGEAGIPLLDVIAAATSVPARMLGLEHETGRVAVGLRADLVLVEGNPARDLGALRRVRLTIRDGVARTPGEWMGC